MIRPKSGMARIFHAIRSTGAGLQREYDYIAVTKPYDPSAIKLATHPVAASPSAMLLAIDK